MPGSRLRRPGPRLADRQSRTREGTWDAQEFGLEHDTWSTTATLAAYRRPLPARGHRAADLRPARRPAPRSRRDPARRSPASGPTRPHPLNLFRVHWYNDSSRTGPRRGPRASRAPARAERRRGDDRRRARQPLPDDRRAQGARGLRLPRPARDHRPLRPDLPSRRLALDRQLLPRRGRDLAPDGLPRRRRAARGDEPRALRLARAVGRASPRTSSARPAPRATSRRSTTAATSSRPIPRTSSSTSSPSSATTSPTTWRPGSALETVFESLRARAAGAAAARLRLRHRLGRDDRGRRLPQGALSAR